MVSFCTNKPSSSATNVKASDVSKVTKNAFWKYVHFVFELQLSFLVLYESERKREREIDYLGAACHFTYITCFPWASNPYHFGARPAN
jgi:hypothetical protein